MYCLLFYTVVVAVSVKLKTYLWGHEISWKISDTCKSAQTYYNNDEYSQTCYLTLEEHTLQCLDSHGDGWNGGYIEIQGKKYCETFTIGKSMTATITISNPGTSMK